jgi:hypothetical protein
MARDTSAGQFWDMQHKCAREIGEVTMQNALWFRGLDEH